MCRKHCKKNMSFVNHRYRAYSQRIETKRKKLRCASAAEPRPNLMGQRARRAPARGREGTIGRDGSRLSQFRLGQPTKPGPHGAASSGTTRARRCPPAAQRAVQRAPCVRARKPNHGRWPRWQSGGVGGRRPRSGQLLSRTPTRTAAAWRCRGRAGSR
jgi:hypothetical protein